MFKTFLLLVIYVLSATCAQAADPTKPFTLPTQSVSKAVKKNALVLQTIIESNDKASVVISGKLLQLGEQIRGYKLSKITSNYVMLSSPEKNLKLSLFSSVVAQ